MTKNHRRGARRAAAAMATTAAAVPLLASSAEANASSCTWPGIPNIGYADMCYKVWTDTPKGGNFMNRMEVSTVHSDWDYYIVAVDGKGKVRWMSPLRDAKYGLDVVCNEPKPGGWLFDSGTKYKSPCHEWPGGGKSSHLGLLYGPPGDITHFSGAVEITSKWK